MISAVVLTHNDEQSIKKTLQSLVWSDEIIVIDDFSTDSTVAVAKILGAKVIQHHLSGDFAGQRNFALTKVKTNWVLFVDSDEVVSGALKSEIQEAIDSRLHGNDKIMGYYFKRQDYLFGHKMEHGETGNVRLLRLAQSGVGSWERQVHEVWEVKGVTKEFHNPLLHYPHSNVAQFLSDINTYSTLNAKYLYSKRVHVPGWHIVAYPTLKFFRNYILLLGFLDGTPGAILAIMMSFHSFLVRAKLYMLWRSS